MGKGAKLPTPEASMSPKSITEHPDSVLTTADQNVFTEMLRRKENFSKGLVAPTMVTQSALNSRFPSRIASPTHEFRPKILETNNINVNRDNNLPTQAQVFPQRRRSSLAGGANLMVGRAYELVSRSGKKGNDGAQLRRKINHLLYSSFMPLICDHSRYTSIQ
ncbi:hypothetical protein KC19_12G115700 [Ceratodon purpureus]|uniref:Uncharacterized protein n=1 Tax=Ceratodon purpureus TaxID=3225 RepID=A0A8T0G8T6_CERPU|nr:hypothetical protein KC19_12G115700 [Ceratodon purpureus]